MKPKEKKATMWTGIGLAAAAAVLYAFNVPFSKLLLAHVDSTMLAGLLYLGAGLGISLLSLFRSEPDKPEEKLDRKDGIYVFGMIVLDIAAPVLLMAGISLSSPAAASLLGNFEIAATSLIACFLFKEAVSKTQWGAIVLILLSSLLLCWQGSSEGMFSKGALLVLAASCCWGLENNCTRAISEKSTWQIVTIKGLSCGIGSIVLALFCHESFPSLRWIIPALVLGFGAYGLSIFTYIRAQRLIGAAKTSSLYALAPFIGAFLSWILFREPLSAGFWAGLVLMAAGTFLTVLETVETRHSHAHTHTRLVYRSGRLMREQYTHSHPHLHAAGMHSNHGQQHSIPLHFHLHHQPDAV